MFLERLLGKIFYIYENVKKKKFGYVTYGIRAEVFSTRPTFGPTPSRLYTDQTANSCFFSFDLCVVMDDLFTGRRNILS